MGRLDEYEALVAVVAHGSLRGAAEATGVPRSTVARLVRRLEARLDAPLFLTERGVIHPTPRARQLADEAARVIADVARLEARAGDLGTTALSVTAPPSAGLPGLSAMIGAFVVARADLRLTLTATSRFVDLAREDIHVAIRAQGAADLDHVRTTIASSQWALWGAPAYRERFGWPSGPNALAGHRLALPALRGPAYGALPVDPPPGVDVVLRTDDLGVIDAVVQAGAALGVLPRLVGQGRPGMDEVLPELAGPAQPVFAVFHRRWRRDPAVRAFVAHAKGWYAPDAGPAS